MSYATTYRRTDTYSGPRRMLSRFDGECAGCGGKIVKGTEITWGRAQGARHFPICPEQSEPVEPKPEQTAPARIAVEDQGVYVLPDGTICKVQANRQKTRTYAKRWTVIGGARLAENGEHVHGEYAYEAGLVSIVAESGRKMSYEEAAAFVLRYGQCARCGRRLKAADSVERGIGPVCVNYFRGE